jgi:hypothetical protein
MPFDPVSDQVFSVLIKPALSRSGYEVERADTSLDQQNILRTIVQGLETADLVVADISGKNANVFYELGLAHAMKKPVVMLARTSNDLVFDVKNYKAIIYGDIAFARPARLKDQLTEQLSPVLIAAKSGDLTFGSPFTDFASAIEPTQANEPEEGILERILALQDPQVVSVLPEIGLAMEELGSQTAEFGPRIAEFSEAGDVQGVLLITGEMGKVWDASAARFENILRLLPDVMLRAERGAVATVQLANLGTERTPETEKTIASIRGMVEAAAASAPQLRTLAATVRTYSQISGFLRQPGNRVASALEAIASQIDRIAGLEGQLA